MTTGKTGRQTELAMLPGEKKLWSGRSPARTTLVYTLRLALVVAPFFLALTVLMLFQEALYVATGMFSMIVALLAITAVLTALAVSRRRYIVTNQRVHVRHGILSINTQTMDLDKIVSISVHRSFLQRLFGLSSIHVTLPGAVIIGQAGAQLAFGLSDIEASSGAADILINAWLPRDNKESS